MPEYNVKWEIDVIAVSPRAAAEQALSVQRDPGSAALVFAVSCHNENWGLVHQIDLSEPDPEKPAVPYTRHELIQELVLHRLKSFSQDELAEMLTNGRIGFSSMSNAELESYALDVEHMRVRIVDADVITVETTKEGGNG